MQYKTIEKYTVKIPEKSWKQLSAYEHSQQWEVSDSDKRDEGDTTLVLQIYFSVSEKVPCNTMNAN